MAEFGMEGARDWLTAPGGNALRDGAISMTPEMPFKDHDPNPDPEFGWSPERSMALGVSCMEVLAGMIGEP